MFFLRPTTRGEAAQKETTFEVGGRHAKARLVVLGVEVGPSCQCCLLRESTQFPVDEKLLD